MDIRNFLKNIVNNTKDGLSAKTVPASIVFHTAVIFLLGFSLPSPSKINESPILDITLVNTHSDKEISNADFLANANQEGSGSKTEKTRITSPLASETPNTENGAAQINAEQTAPDIIPERTPEILTTKAMSNTRIVNQPDKKPVEEINKRDSEISKKAEKIAQLMAEMSLQEEKYAKRPRIHFLDSLSTKSAVEAEYIMNWSKKLERVGNINFPKQALALNLNGTLILNATLDRAGRVVEIQVSVSSGSKILDQAAINIVKLAAPYEPLPKEVREKYDRLNITRSIIFHKDKSKPLFYSQ